MGEISAVATAALTVCLVWLLSWFLTKLKSLPIDFGLAGLSLVVLFFDLANREMNAGNTFGGLNPIWVVGFVVVTAIFLLSFAICVFKSSLGELPESIVSEYRLGESLFREAGYWVSLSLSLLFLLFAVSAASNARELLRIDLESRGGLQDFFTYVTSMLGWNPIVLIGLLLSITIYLRYFYYKNATCFKGGAEEK